MSFKDFYESFPEGVKSMVPAIMILILAWTLSGISNGDYLDIGGFIGGVVGNNLTLLALLLLVLFLIATGLSFATATSWGTFSILIPIAIAILGSIYIKSTIFLIYYHIY